MNMARSSRLFQSVFYRDADLPHRFAHRVAGSNLWTHFAVSTRLSKTDDSDRRHRETIASEHRQRCC